MPIWKLRNGESVTDEEFDSIFPTHLQNHSNRHYTSVYTAQLATQFLASTQDATILDVGSGAGKFCLVAASCSTAQVTGVELRKDQCSIAKEFAEKYQLSNVQFIHASILEIDFYSFSGVYIFNPFLENIDPSARMDTTIETKEDNHTMLTNYVFEQLSRMKIGSRLVTFWTPDKQVPNSFELVKSLSGGSLRFWEKTN